jgi:hypothetical protein
LNPKPYIHSFTSLNPKSAPSPENPNPKKTLTP